MTVNVQTRATAAHAINQYLNREIDNDGLDSALLEAASKDTACYELRRALVDTLYSLWDCHKNEGDYELTARQQRMFQRWVVFLRSREEWPVSSRFNWSSGLRLLAGLYDCLLAFVSGTSPLTNEYWPYETSADWQKLEQQH